MDSMNVSTSTTKVAGVPKLFVRPQLASSPIVVQAYLAINIVVVVMALALGVFPAMAVPINLVYVALSVAGILILRGQWKPDSVVINALAITAMVLMWCTVVFTVGWTLLTIPSLVSLAGLGIGVGPIVAVMIIFAIIGVIQTLIMAALAVILKARTTPATL